jgi:hypothetical protein
MSYVTKTIERLTKDLDSMAVRLANLAESKTRTGYNFCGEDYMELCRIKLRLQNAKLQLQKLMESLI